MSNERYAVEFYNKKGEMEFGCGLVNIDDVVTEFAKDPARKALVFDFEGSFANPVAVFEKLPKKRTWTRTL